MATHLTMAVTRQVFSCTLRETWTLVKRKGTMYTLVKQ